MKRTAEEINILKAQWIADPDWDLEYSEGFEDHRDELLTFSREMSEKWEAKRVEEWENKAKSLGCTVELLNYITHLERKIEQLQAKVFPNG